MDAKVQNSKLLCILFCDELAEWSESCDLTTQANTALSVVPVLM